MELPVAAAVVVVVAAGPLGYRSPDRGFSPGLGEQVLMLGCYCFEWLYCCC